MVGHYKGPDFDSQNNLSRSLAPIVERSGHVQTRAGYEEWMTGRLTKELAQRSSPPIGAKTIPMAKKSGRTVFGVRIGL